MLKSFSEDNDLHFDGQRHQTLVGYTTGVHYRCKCKHCYPLNSSLRHEKGTVAPMSFRAAV
jgi:hypothetical protein